MQLRERVPCGPALLGGGALQVRVRRVGAPASDAAATAASLLGVAGVLTTADDAGFVFARERFTGVAVCFFAPGSGFTSTQASSVFTKFRAVLFVLGLLAGASPGCPRAYRGASRAP